MEHLIEFGLFAGKIIVLFCFIFGVVALVVGLVARQKLKPELEIENINHKLENLQNMLEESVLDKTELKNSQKERKKKEKEEEKNKIRKAHIFYLKFEGDIHAKAVDQLRDEITAILTIAHPNDEVVLSIESPGGTVHGYGLAAAQLLRLKDANLKITACVDRVAASGGYMMACTANKILAAPFAILGSIGVLAQVPNFHKLLKKHDVDYEEISSGEYKRTVSILGEITDKGRTKFLEQITDTHLLFKEFVKKERPLVDIAQVATGEYWYGLRAKELNLVDQIMTSDAYLFSRRNDTKIFSVKYLHKTNLSEKISKILGHAAEMAFTKVTEKIMSRPQI